MDVDPVQERAGGEYRRQLVPERDLHPRGLFHLHGSRVMAGIGSVLVINKLPACSTVAGKNNLGLDLATGRAIALIAATTMLSTSPSSCSSWAAYWSVWPCSCP